MKKLLTFFLVLSLFYSKVNFNFQGSRGGPTFSRGEGGGEGGGSNFFQGGGPIAYSL